MTAVRCCPGRRSRGLAGAIRTWHDAPDRWEAAAERARAAVSDARADAAERFDALLRAVAAGRSPEAEM